MKVLFQKLLERFQALALRSLLKTHRIALTVLLLRNWGGGEHEAVHEKTKNLGFQNHSSLFIQAQELNFIAALKFPPQKHEITHDKREAAPVATFQQ